MNDNKRKLYDALSKDYDMGTYEQFCSDIADNDKRKKLFDAASKDYDFGDYDSFSNQLGFSQEAAQQEETQAVKPVEPVAPQPIQADLNTANSPADTVQMQSPVEVAKPTVETQPEKPVEQPTPEQQQRKALESSTREQVSALRSTIDDNLNAATQESIQAYEDEAEAARKGGFWKQLQYSLAHDVGHDPASIATRENLRMTKGMGNMELQGRIAALQSAQNSLKDAQRIIDEADKAQETGKFDEWLRGSWIGNRVDDTKRFTAGAARGLGQHLFDTRTWDMGMSDLSDNGALLVALNKFDKGEDLTESEQMMLDAKAVELATNAYFGSYVGRGYKAGSVTAESIPFMLEMCINPASGAGTAASSKLTRYALERFGKKAVKDNAKKYVAAKAATRVAADVAGAAAMAATTGAVGVAADAESRIAGINDGSFTTNEEGYSFFNGYREGEDPATALAKAFGARTIENHSELVGNYFAPVLGIAGKGVSKGLEKVGLGKVNKFITDVKMSDIGKLVTDFEQHAHWNGLLGEFAEELVGGVENAIVVGDQTIDANPETGVFNPSQMLDTFLGVSLMGGFLSSAKTAGYVTSKYKSAKNLNNADAKAQAIFGDEDWGTIKDEVRNSIEDKDLTSIDARLNEEQDPVRKQAILDYLGAYVNKQGADIGTMKRRTEEEIDPVQFEAETSYDNGYELTDPQDMEDAQNMLEYRRQVLKEKTGFEDITLDQMLHPWDNQDDMPFDWTPEEKQAGIDYINAKATYEGMIQHVKDDIDSKITAAHAAIDANTNVDTKRIQPATMKTEDRKVYIVGGVAKMFEDGSGIDKENSDGSVIVKDVNTGAIEMVSPADILSLDEEIDPVDEKNAIQEQIRNTVAQEAADKIDGKVQFVPGQQYTLPDAEGNSITYQITPDPVTGKVADFTAGVVNAVVVGGPLNQDGTPVIVQIPIAPIQEQHEMESLARLEQYEQNRLVEKVSIAQNEQQSQAAERQYQQEDELSLRNADGTVVRGSIVSEPNEDGQYEVYTEEPFNGKKVNLLTKEEIENSIVLYNGNEVQKPVDEVAQESMPEQQPQAQEPVDNRPAIDRIPVNEAGEPVFEKGNAADTWQALLDMNDGNKEEAIDTANQMYETAKGELEKALKAKPKSGKTVFEIQQNKAQVKSAITAARQKADYWKSIVDFEANQKRIAEEEAKRQKRMRLAKAREILRREGRFKEENAQLGEPISFRDYVLRSISTGGITFKWGNDKNNAAIKGLGAHLGFNGQFGEMARRGWMLNKEEGLYPEQAAEDLLQGYAEELGMQDVEQTGLDTMEALNEVLDVVNSFDTPRSMFDAAKGLHGQMDFAAQEQAYIESQMQQAEEQEQEQQPESVVKNPLTTEQESVSREDLVADVADMIQQSDGDMRLLDYLDDDELKQFSDLYNKFITVNETFGDMSMKLADALHSKNKKVAAEAKAQIDAAQQAAVDAFNPIMDLYGGLLKKYNLSDEEDLPSDNEVNTPAAEIEQARQEVNVEPTEGQKQAGNYKMGHIKLDGYDISLENPKGSIRKGVDENGKQWQSEMHNDYGYLRGTQGVDGDHIDVFLSDTPEQGNVYVVDQVNPKTGEFDEHKVMYGFNSVEEAQAAYLSNYEEGWQGLGNITPVSKEEFKKWIDSSHRKTKPFAEYAGVKPLEEVQQSGDYKVGDTFSNETGLTGTVDAIAPNGDIRLNLTQKIQFGPDGHTQRWFKPEEFANYAEHNGMKPLQDVAVSEEEPVVKQVDVEGLFNALKTKGEARLSDFATPIDVPKQEESVPKAEESEPKQEETVPKTEESVPKQPLGTIRTGKHTKTGEDLWIVTPTDRVSKEEFSQLKAAAKERDGYYSSFKPNNGFIFKTEEDAKAFNEENSREPSEPVSLDTMKSVVGGSFDTVEAKQEETKENEPARKWQYELYVSKEGYSRITRSDMSNPYGIEDEFEITADNPEDLKGILENNGMTEILDSIGDKLHNRIVLWQVHQQAQNEGFHGYKIGDNIIYTSGNKEYPGVVTDFEEYGEHLPVVDTGLAPVMYEVAHLDQIRHAEEPVEKVEQPANPSGNKLVTDERYAELKRRMLDKLKGQMNMGIDPEILAIGTEMAVYHIEKGTRKFVDYAKSMIEDLGDVIRPYLKAFYNGARDLPEMGDLAKEMTPYDEVSSIDTANFDKSTTDVFAAAETIAKEQEVEEQADEAKERIKTSTKPLNNKKKTVPSRSESMGSLFADIEEGTENEPTNTDNNELSTGSTSKNGEVGEGAQQKVERTSGTGVVGNNHGNSAVDNGGSTGLAERTPQAAVKKNKSNNHVERGESYAPTSPGQRFSANVAAIKKMRELTDAGKQATKEDMSILRQFTGWGGLGTYFNNEYSQENRQLKSLLSSEEYEGAVMSANSAYYTPVNIIDAMWDAAKNLGFTGGTVLEGSAGIGNILASMPKKMSEASDITAVEIDSVTGNILKLLYPDATVHIKGFEETEIPNNSVDLAITNVPFVTGLRVNDEVEQDLSRKFGDIHDFCIAKNVRKLKEGGIGIFITSKGTLDKSKALRSWLVNQGDADVIGAFRLNNDTFVGTSVTSDIIIVRKRVNGKPSPNAIDVSGTTVTRRGTYSPMRYGEKDEPVAMEYNTYFVEHPENMAGEMAFAFEKGDTFRPKTAGLYKKEGLDQDKAVAKWVKSLRNDGEKVQATANEQQEEQEKTENVKEGQIIVNSKGEICVSRRGQAVPLGVNSNKVKGQTKATVIKDYDAIKEALKAVLDYQMKNDSDEGLKPLLKSLNDAYDSFVKKYGQLNKNVSISFLRDDVDFAAISAIENFKEVETIDGKKKIETSKTDVFSRRMVGYKAEPTPKTSKEGVIVSMNQFGRIDLDYIASKVGMPVEDVRKEIIDNGLGFEDPRTGHVEVSYEYLSGNVREKLEYARKHNEGGKYDANIKALEKVVPLDIPAHLIEFSLGSDWLDPKLYVDFAREKFGLNDEFKVANIGGVWQIVGGSYAYFDQNNEKNRSAGITSDIVGKTATGHELMICAMNNTPYVFQKTVTHGYGSDKWTETVTDKAASQAATARMAEIQEEFKEWCKDKMLNDEALAAEVTKIYNDLFNAVVPKEVGEEFLPEHFDGSNMKINLYDHQKKAIIRGTTEPLMLAHEVGSGKTFTLISTAMEMRRLGTAKKPMIVVQNATVGQFVSEAKKLYPNAKVLTITEKDRSQDGRAAFYAKIKYNDWDLIIIPQSVLDTIPDSEERQQAFIQEKIDEKMFVLEQAKTAKADYSAIKQLEKELADLQKEYDTGISVKASKKDAKKEAVAKNNAAVRAKQQLTRKIDDVENFDDMGIDALLIDEAHEYKHLGFSTALKRGVKGVDPSYSKKSAGVYLKTRAVFDKSGWKNVVFATGTPISNTAAEIWTFMKYLMPADVMKQNHIYYFDDFVRNFGKIAQSLEFATNGKFKENTRFGAYVNLPELVRIWSSVSDTVLTKDAEAASGVKLTEKLPEMEGGKAQDIFLPQSPSLIGIMRKVKQTLEDYDKLSGKEKKAQSHIPLTMYGIAKRAAIDPRLIDPEAADEPLSKTNKAVEEILKDLEATKEYNGTCAVFCDNYRRLEYDETTGKKKETFNLFYEIKRKLVEAGVPENQIVVMESGMTVEKKEKIFAQVNEGTVRVILGSTRTLGTGVNIQQRLHLLIHMDAPDRPMDYTQRNGRILRQGNLHKQWDKTVKVLRFGVEDSLDVTSYQRLKTKSAFIDSVMDGKPLLSNGMENRVLEEEEEGLFDNPVAVLSGSQFALKKSQAERELRKYQNKLKQYQQDQIYIERQLKDNKAHIERNVGYIADYEKSIAKANETFKDGKVKVVTVAGVPCRTEEELSAAIREKITKPLEETKSRARNDYGWTAKDLSYTLSFDGIDVNVTFTIGRKEGSYINGQNTKPSATTSIHYKCPDLMQGIEFTISPMDGIKGIVERFRNEFATGQYQQNTIDRMKANNERMASDNELMQQRRGVPFGEQDKLDEAKDRVAEYTKLMKDEMAEKEKKYAEAQAVESNINLDNVDADEEDEDTNRYRGRDDFEDVDISEAQVKEGKIKINGALRFKLTSAFTGIKDPNHVMKWVKVGCMTNCTKHIEARFERSLGGYGTIYTPSRYEYDESGREVFIPDGTYITKDETDQLWLDLDKVKDDLKEVLEKAADYHNYIRGSLLFRDAYHGSAADFDNIDLAHAGEGEGEMAHGFGVYVTFDRKTGTMYAWQMAVNDAENKGLLDSDIMRVIYNDSFDSYEQMVTRYDQLLANKKKNLAEEYKQAVEEKDPYADYLKKDLYEANSLKPMNEALAGLRNVYTIDIPDDNGKNYLDERKIRDGKELAPILDKIEVELIKDGVDLNDKGYYLRSWDQTKDELKETGGSDKYLYDSVEMLYQGVKQLDVANATKSTSELFDRIGFVGMHYVGSRDGECAVIFNADNAPVTNQERFRIREKEAPVKTGTGYKVFVLKNGRLYPPMVNNAGGVDTPVFLWLDAEAAPIAGQSKTGRNKVKSGGGTLAYRPGWHLGKIPYALQFNRGEKVDNPLGVRSIKGDLVKVGKYFPKNFVWAEVEYAADKNYQKEAMSYGYNENGKFQHSLAGLPAIPEDGYYEYRTNANPATDPWIITGAMRVKKILTPSEVDALVEAAGRKPQLREEGAYSDAQIEQLNESLSKLNEDSADSKIETAMSLAESLGVKVNVIEDRDQITDKNRTRQRRKRNSKGWYDTISQEIVVVIPNNVNNADVEATILHEIVGHKGMRELVGDENYNDFLEKVYRAADPELRKKITELAARKGWDFNLATEEYIASLAENGFNDRLERNLFEKIRDLFVDMLRRAKIALGHNINDNDLRYMLWRAYKGRIKSALDLAEDINARMNMQVGDYAESNNNVNFVSNERRGNQTNDNDRTERNDGTGLAENNARRLGAKHTLGDTGVFEEELAAQRSRYNDADPTNYIEGQISESLIDAAKREGKFIPWEEATSAGTRLHGNTKESICLVSEDQSKITKLKDPFAARATKGNTPFDIIEELIVHNELFPETAYRLVGITQDRLGDMRFVLEQDYIKAATNAKENDIAEHLQSLGLKDEGRFIFGDERCAVLDAYGDNVLVDENGNLRFIDPIIRIKQSPDGDIRYRSGEARDLYEQAERRTNKEGQKTSTANLFHRLHEAYQDSMLALKELQKAISKETGNRIEDNENAYIAENAMSSQNKAQADIYRQKFYNPLLDALKALMKQGAKYNDIVSYAIAKHGLERNEYMARKKAAEDMADKWKEFKEKYSGVGPETTDNNLLTAMESERAKLEEREEKLYAKYSKMDFSGLKGITGDEDNFTSIAEMMVEDFEKKYDTKELWDKVNKATKETLYKNYASGLMSRETYNTVKGMFDYYIPLRGWDSNVAANEYDYLLSSKPLFSQTLKTMRGRTSVADDPFATIGHIAESAIALGNRNLMKQKFLNFVLNNPTSLATVSKQWYVKDPATGEWEPRNPYIPEDATPDEITNIIEQFEQDMRELELSGNAKTERRGLNLSKHATVYEGQEHVVRVKRNGVEYAIYINGNPRAAQALNGLTNPNASESKLLQKAQAIKNFMARMFTSQNPAFIITNLSRDAIWSGTAVAIKENARYNEQYQRNIIAALTKGKLIKLVSKFNNGKLDDSVPIEKYFAEFIKNGGETGFTQLNTVEDFKRDMRRFVKDIEKGGTPVPTKVWRSIWDGIEFMNRCAEDTTRFAVYMTSRQMGRSVSRSVFDAKEITVNFNKKGSGGYLSQFMNFAYIFFNATVQSIANITKLAKEHPGKMSATVGLYTAAGILTPLLALCVGAAFGGGDDDDEETYWDLPEWVRRNNLVFRIPWSTNGYITIPLPHELRPFYGIGEIAFSCIMGKENVEDGMKKGAEGFSSMIPLDFTGNAGNTAVNFTPTIAQPFAQLIANVDFFGTPIYKRNGYNELDPEWTKAYKGTNAWVVNGTKWLNDVTGGDNVKKGVIDLNPAVIEHLYESYFGGVGKTINRAAKTVSMVWDEDMREWRNVPVASSFIQKADERTSGSQLNREYYNYKEEHDKVEHELAGYKKQLRMGAMEYAEVLNDFIESEEFQRYRKLHGYIEAVQKMNTALKYTDELKREELEENIKNLKKTLVEELHNEKDSNK